MLSKTCHTGGVLEGYTVAFKGPNDSITSLQLPCSVTERTATNSPRAYLARRCVHWPFCGTLTATLKATVTPGGALWLALATWLAKRRAKTPLDSFYIEVCVLPAVYIRPPVYCTYVKSEENLVCRPLAVTQQSVFQEKKTTHHKIQSFL